MDGFGPFFIFWYTVQARAREKDLAMPDPADDLLTRRQLHVRFTVVSRSTPRKMVSSYTEEGGIK